MEITFTIYVVNCTMNKFVCYNIMSVNIFGSNGTFPHDVNNHYVDLKFTTLGNNLASKVNTTGDTMAGDLTLLMNDDQHRTCGVSDLSSGKGVSLLLVIKIIKYNTILVIPLKMAAVPNSLTLMVIFVEWEQKIMSEHICIRMLL